MILYLIVFIQIFIVVEMECLNTKNKRRIENIMATLQELRDAIAQIGVAVEADVAQTALVVTAVNALIAKINASGTTDFATEVAALSAATAQLSSDNAAVQTALDEAGPASA